MKKKVVKIIAIVAGVCLLGGLGYWAVEGIKHARYTKGVEVDADSVVTTEEPVANDAVPVETKTFTYEPEETDTSESSESVFGQTFTNDMYTFTMNRMRVDGSKIYIYFTCENTSDQVMTNQGVAWFVAYNPNGNVDFVSFEVDENGEALPFEDGLDGVVLLQPGETKNFVAVADVSELSSWTLLGGISGYSFNFDMSKLDGYANPVDTTETKATEE